VGADVRKRWRRWIGTGRKTEKCEVGWVTLFGVVRYRRGEGRWAMGDGDVGGFRVGFATFGTEELDLMVECENGMGWE